MALADTLALPMERLRSRYAGSALAGFLGWWRRELAACLPLRWRRWFGAGGDGLWLRQSGEAVVLEARGDAGPVELARAPLSDAAALAARIESEQPLRLLLAGTHVLRRELSLPEAAGERLRDVLGHEIDRQTPFRREQVVYDWRVLARIPAQRQLQVELVVMPRAVLDQLLASLGPLAARLAAIDVAAADGTPLGVNLLPSERRLRRTDPVLWLNLGLAAFTALALGYALWQTLENRREAVAALNAEIEARRDEARRVAALRERLVDAAEGANFLARARAERPATVEVIDDISRRLPDGTWLERLNINDGRLVITGYSGEASATVGRLQGSPFLTSPALAGSVQADPRTGRDRFTLTADLAVPTEAADATARQP